MCVKWCNSPDLVTRSRAKRYFFITHNFRMEEAKEPISKRAKRRSGAFYANFNKKTKQVESFLKWLDYHDYYEFDPAHQWLFLKAVKQYSEGDEATRWVNWWKWCQGYYYMVANQDLKIADYNYNEMRALNEREQEEKARNAWIQADEITPVDFQKLLGLNREHLRDKDIWLDPECNDKTIKDLWLGLVPMEIQEGVFFKDMNGNGFVYSPSKALWEELEAKQIQTHVFTVFEKLDMKSKFRFSRPEVEKLWLKQMGNIATYQGFFTILRGLQRVPHPYEEKLDALEWYIPVANEKVYRCSDGKLLDRELSNFFTRAAKFSYLNTRTNSKGQVINDYKTRVALMKQARVKIDPPVILNGLRSMFPNVMAFVEQSFKDPDRLWFIILRMGAMLSGYCTRESLFVYGKGKGGKSTLFQTILQVAGDLGIILGKPTFIKSKTDSAGSHNTDRMRAVRRRACLVDELESTDQMNESLIKNWVSHQIVPLREIYGKQQEVRMNSSLTFLTNEPPRFSLEDTVIQERITAVKVTTKFFDEHCSPNEKPATFKSRSEWKDGYSKQEDIEWIYRTKESFDESLTFATVLEKRNELGTFLCICARLVYIMVNVHRHVQLPIPDIVLKDKQTFFAQSDVVGYFIQEYYDRETDKKKGLTLKEVYKKFTEQMKDYGLKHFTLQAFKTNLSSKNLLFTVAAKKAQTVKLKLREDTKATGFWP